MKLREKYDNVEVISEKESRKLPKKISQNRSLFVEKKLVILENLDPKNLKLPSEIEYDLVLWFDNTINPPSKVDKVWLFKDNSQISSFRLADQIAYGREKQALETLYQLLKSPKEQEMIIGTITRQFKLLTLALKGELIEVSQSEYVRSKVSEQARNWNLGKVRTGLLHLLKSDLLLKTGRVSTDTVLANLTTNLCRLAEV